MRREDASVVSLDELLELARITRIALEKYYDLMENSSWIKHQTSVAMTKLNAFVHRATKDEYLGIARFLFQAEDRLMALEWNPEKD